jgi:hypothetical protein
MTGRTNWLARRIAGVRHDVVDRAGQLLSDAESGTVRGTRKRSAGMAIVGIGALGFLYTLVSNGVLAVQFTAANTAYNVYSAEVVGANAAGYVNAQATQSGTNVGVAQIGFKSATLAGLCVIVPQSTPVGPISMMLTAGQSVKAAPTGTNTVNASFLYIASDNLTGNGDNIAGMTLGQSADTVTMGGTPFPTGQTGTAGNFGLQAVTLDIKNLNARSYGIYLQGAINLPALKINVLSGTKTQADCP